MSTTAAEPRSSSKAELLLEAADGPFTAEPLLRAPVDSVRGAKADRLYAGTLAGLVSSADEPLGGAGAIFFCMRPTPLLCPDAAALPSELRARLVGPDASLLACTTLRALPGTGASRFYEDEAVPRRTRLAFEQGSSAGWELVGAALREGSGGDSVHLRQVQDGLRAGMDEPAEGAAALVSALGSLQHEALPEAAMLASAVRRGLEAQLRSSAALLPQHELDWLEMCLPDWQEAAGCACAEPVRPPARHPHGLLESHPHTPTTRSPCLSVPPLAPRQERARGPPSDAGRRGARARARGGALAAAAVREARRAPRRARECRAHRAARRE